MGVLLVLRVGCLETWSWLLIAIEAGDHLDFCRQAPRLSAIVCKPFVAEVVAVNEQQHVSELGSV